MNIRANNTKNPYSTQIWAFQPIGRPGLAKERKLNQQQQQNNNVRKPNANVSMVPQQNEMQTANDNILSKRFSSPSAKLLPEIQPPAGNTGSNVASKQSAFKKLESDDYDIKVKNVKPGSSRKISSLTNSTENLHKVYDTADKDLEQYTENRMNELYPKTSLTKDKNTLIEEKRSSIKSQNSAKTHAIMTKPISQIETIEKRILKGNTVIVKSNTNLNESRGETIQADNTPLTNETSWKTSKPPISSQSRRMARQRVSTNGFINKTQDNFGPSSINELTTDNDFQNFESKTGEKMITVLNEGKIILGPVGRNPIRSHTQNVYNESSQKIIKTPERLHGTITENRSSGHQTTCINSAPKQILKLKLGKAIMEPLFPKTRRLDDVSDSVLDFGLGTTQRNEDTSEIKHRMDEFIIERQLGQGSYAVVRLAREKRTNQKFAIKTYEKFKLYDATRRKNVKREISLLQGLDHPNIIKLHYTIDSSTQINLVMEMGGQQSLYSYLKTKPGRKLNEDEAKLIFKQIVQGIKYVHGRNIAHRDLKLENILLDDQKKVKIIDFGFSVQMEKDKSLSTFCGTPSYMAPELVSKKDYNGSEVDVWALGILLYTLLSGKFPFKGENDRDLYKKIARGNYQRSKDVSVEAQMLISKILRVNPQERLTASQILEDNWIMGLENSHEDFQNFITEKLQECKNNEKIILKA